MTKLSDIPSEALLQALEDLESIEQDSRYVIDMSQWHLRVGDHCRVCLAGATLINEVPWDQTIGKNNICEELGVSRGSRFNAINCFRWGQIDRGLDLWGINGDTTMAISKNTIVVPYSQDPAAFKDGIKTVVARLKELGH